MKNFFRKSKKRIENEPPEAENKIEFNMNKIQPDSKSKDIELLKTEIDKLKELVITSFPIDRKEKDNNEIINNLNKNLFDFYNQVEDILGEMKEITDIDLQKLSFMIAANSAIIDSLSDFVELSVQDTVKSKDISAVLLYSLEIGKQNISRIIDAIRELNAFSRRIGEEIKHVDDISEKTHVLSINASIEAARVGMHGKGFAVVSQEIRKLATKTANTVKSIKDIINQMFTKIEKGFDSSSISDENLFEIDNQVKQTVDLLLKISDSTKNLLEPSKEAKSNYNEIVDIIDNFVSRNYSFITAFENFTENVKNYIDSSEEIDLESENDSFDEIKRRITEQIGTIEAMYNRVFQTSVSVNDFEKNQDFTAEFERLKNEIELVIESVDKDKNSFLIKAKSIYYRNKSFLVNIPVYIPAETSIIVELKTEKQKFKNLEAVVEKVFSGGDDGFNTVIMLSKIPKKMKI